MSPGNLTNVAFYASFAEDLASNGYVVVGIDHPYSVVAVEMSDGSLATSSGAVTPEMLPIDMDQRVADIRFVLDRVDVVDVELSFLEGRIDNQRIGVMGHSLGGIAAAEACREDDRLDACLNIDGQDAGGPFSIHPGDAAPDQSFVLLTKELELHPTLLERFESAGKGAFRVVVPAASHENFADGSLFEPSLVPWSRTRDNVMAAARNLTVAFFEYALKGASVERLGAAAVPTDVFVNVYPLGDKPSLQS